MIHSTYHHKDTNEDPKTSAVFENLMLLPDNVFWHILRQSCFSNSDMPINSGRLLSYNFWPHWDRTNTINPSYVEPDLFIEFEEFDVIVEAKYGEKGGQYKDQWKKEIISYHNEYGKEKPFVFIAIGGNKTIQAETILFKDEKVKIYKCNWLSLLMSVNKYEKELEAISVPDMNISATKRLLDNIIMAFNINGVYNIDWFNSLKHSQKSISETSINNMNIYFKW